MVAERIGRTAEAVRFNFTDIARLVLLNFAQTQHAIIHLIVNNTDIIVRLGSRRP
jgi:hypothetical protein